MLSITNRVTSESKRVITQLICLNILSIFKHAGGPGVKIDDDKHLSWLGPESFSLLLGLSGSVPGNSLCICHLQNYRKFAGDGHLSVANFRYICW